MNELEGLMKAYRSWDFYDFMDNIFLNCFPHQKQLATDKEKGVI